MLHDYCSGAFRLNKLSALQYEVTWKCKKKLSWWWIRYEIHFPMQRMSVLVWSLNPTEIQCRWNVFSVWRAGLKSTLDEVVWEDMYQRCILPTILIDLFCAGRMRPCQNPSRTGLVSNNRPDSLNMHIASWLPVPESVCVELWSKHTISQ